MVQPLSKGTQAQQPNSSFKIVKSFVHIFHQQIHTRPQQQLLTSPSYHSDISVLPHASQTLSLKCWPLSLLLTSHCTSRKPKELVWSPEPASGVDITKKTSVGLIEYSAEPSSSLLSSTLSHILALFYLHNRPAPSASPPISTQRSTPSFSHCLGPNPRTPVRLFPPSCILSVRTTRSACASKYILILVCPLSPLLLLSATVIASACSPSLLFPTGGVYLPIGATVISMQFKGMTFPLFRCC